MLTSRRICRIVAVVAVASMALASCARQISPGVYTGEHVGEVRETYLGTLQSARVVTVQEDELLEDNRTGGLLGGVAGGAAASRVGQGTGKAVAIAGGALAGAALGALAERSVKRQDAMEYIVRLDDGALLTVVQGMQPPIGIGQRVYVQESARGRSRVLPVG
jgi:outer membrane lipoprotein SlyB